MHRKSTQQRQLAARGFWGRVAHTFRERQVYVRSRGQVQFVTVKPYMLVFGLFVVLTSFFWLAFASINVSFKDELIAVKERHLYQSKLDSEDRISELRKQIDKLNAKLLLDQNGYLKEVDKVHREYKTLVERHDRLSGFFRQGWMPVKSVLPPNTSHQPVQKKNGKQNFSPNRSSKTTGKTSAKSSFNELTFGQKYASVFRNKKSALKPLKDLRAEMTKFDTMQEKLLSEVVVYADVQTKKASKIYKRLGLNPTRVLESAKVASADSVADSVGGPFIAARPMGPKTVNKALKDAISALNETQSLQRQASRLPLAMPVRNIKRFSSRFGLRRDPMRRVAAMHTGVDIKAPYRARIKTPASGLVVYSGWGGGYGRLVKIKHANGIETRYAHMAKILVKKGQYVKAGQSVGLLGNSGRSTGAHLHYETRVNGRPINPARFWKARRDFQSLSQ